MEHVCAVFVSGGVLSEGPRLQAITPANLPLMAQSCLTARPPCCMRFPDTIHYFREMKLFMCLFVCFIFKCRCYVRRVKTLTARSGAVQLNF